MVTACVSCEVGEGGGGERDIKRYCYSPFVIRDIALPFRDDRRSSVTFQKCIILAVDVEP